MLRRRDLEEKRRNKAEEKVAETAEAAKKAAEAALTRDPFDPRAAAFSANPVDKGPGGGFGGSNRAEKYLPPLPPHRPSCDGERTHEGSRRVAHLS